MSWRTGSWFEESGEERRSRRELQEIPPSWLCRPPRRWHQSPPTPSPPPPWRWQQPPITPSPPSPWRWHRSPPSPSPPPPRRWHQPRLSPSPPPLPPLHIIPKPDNCTVTNMECQIAKTEYVIQYFKNRERTCADLRKHDIGKTVTLVGWVTSNTNKKLLHLRDGYGYTQIVMDKSLQQIFPQITPYETILEISGHVVERPSRHVNKTLATGDVEVKIKTINLINPQGQSQTRITNTNTGNNSNSTWYSNTTTTISPSENYYIATTYTYPCMQQKNSY